MPNIPIIRFNAGLVTPHVDARADSPEYEAACRVLQNFIARMYGSAERRPGTYYVNGMRDSDTPTTISGVTTCLLVPFVYSRDVAYVLEFTGYYIRIYYDDAVVDEIDSPYDESDLFELHFEQLGDVIWITHDEYAQRKFTRINATTFELSQIIIKGGPFLKRNDLAMNDGKTMTLSESGMDITDDQTYNASENATTAYKAFDNNSLTFWYGEGVDSWVSVQFGAGKTVKRWRLVSLRVRYFKIQGSNNGTDWSDIAMDGWSGCCQEYGSGNTEVTTSYYTATVGDGWYEITSANTTSYTYYRAYILGLWPSAGVSFGWFFEIKMSESKTEESDDTATLTCSVDHFDEDHVGALFALTQPRVNSSVAVYETGTGSSDELLVEGTWTLSIHTGWIATVQLERKIKEDSYWEVIRQWTAYTDTRAIQISGFEDEDNAYYRVTVSAYTSGTISGELTCDEANHTGICRVIEYTSATVVKVIIVKDFVSENATARWYEGAWSDYRGYPSSSTFIEDRCVYGGMKVLANDTSLATVWLSGSGDYEDFKAGTNGDDSFEILPKTTGTLQWVEAMDNLMIGTTAGIFIIRSSRMDTVLVPNPPPICRQVSAYPCDRVRPVKTMKTMLYLSGRQLRELAYDRNSYVLDSDLTAMTEHITYSPIKGMALQTNPDTILWCWHEDGSSSAFVYDRENDIMAWAEMPLALSGGGIEPNVKSFCVIPDLGNGDDIYVAVHRIINGPAVYDGADAVYDDDEEVRDKMSVIYVEKFAKRFE